MNLEIAFAEMKALRSAENRIHRELWRQRRAHVPVISPRQIAATVYERMEHKVPLPVLEEMSSDYCRSVFERNPGFAGGELAVIKASQSDGGE